MKNPFMSMFLSGANKIAGSARAQATAAVKRETARNARQMTKAWTDALILIMAGKFPAACGVPPQGERK